MILGRTGSGASRDREGREPGSVLLRTVVGWIAVPGAAAPGPDGSIPSADAGNRYRMDVSGFLIRAGLVLGTVLLVPSLLYAVREGMTALVVADSAVYVLFLVLYFLNRRKPRQSAGGLAGLVFGFGCYLLAADGPAAAGGEWMAASVTLAAVFFGSAGGAVAASFVARSLERALAERERLSRQLAERSAALEREAAERLGAERRAEFHRDFDGRTGLPNRERFLRELERTLVPASRRGRPLSVLAVGVHRPGLIFDEYGHVQGEAAIAAAAGRLREAFREDDVVARFGVALFFVLCSDMGSPDDIAELLPKAFSAFERPVESGSHLIHVAGAVREGTLVPWFQPKVDLRGAVVGAEALARWPRPDGSLGLPSDFIPVAERAGLMEALGRDILRKSCRRALEWNAGAARRATVAVNLSPQALRKPAIAEEVRKALEETGLDPALLELEITETGLALAAEAAVPRLRELKSLGVSLAIDDFGTGASGISRLRDFPVDFVKLPPDLVEPLPSDRRSRAIVKAVIDLAHALGFRVVAEGVESSGQLEWLGEASCDLFQGYLFSPSVPADRFGEMLGRRCGGTPGTGKSV